MHSYYRETEGIMLYYYAFNIAYKQLIELIYPNVVAERNLHVDAFACIQ